MFRLQSSATGTPRLVCLLPFEPEVPNMHSYYITMLLGRTRVHVATFHLFNQVTDCHDTTVLQAPQRLTTKHCTHQPVLINPH